MFTNDPRNLGYNGNTGHTAGFNTGYNTGYTNGGTTMASPEVMQLLTRLDAHMLAMTEMFRTVIGHGVQPFGMHAHAHSHMPMNNTWGNFATPNTLGFNGFTNAPWTAAYGMNPTFNRGLTANEIVRIRETESHIFCDIFLPQLTAGDVEVEVSGTRIICRTRVPVGPAGRMFSSITQLPRGFEFFELPDGRIECSWLCPVTFVAKEVEATFRDGILSIFVNKSDSANHRQTVKVGKETRRSATEMNS